MRNKLFILITIIMGIGLIAIGSSGTPVSATVCDTPTPTPTLVPVSYIITPACDKDSQPYWIVKVSPNPMPQPGGWLVSAPNGFVVEGGALYTPLDYDTQIIRPIYHALSGGLWMIVLVYGNTVTTAYNNCIPGAPATFTPTPTPTPPAGTTPTATPTKTPGSATPTPTCNPYAPGPGGVTCPTPVPGTVTPTPTPTSPYAATPCGTFNGAAWVSCTPTPTPKPGVAKPGPGF